MARFVPFLVFLAGLGGVGSAAQPAPPKPPAGSVVKVPIELVSGGLVLVQAKVNGHPGWFILDNATEGFLADGEYAGRISLRSGESVNTRGAGKDPIQALIERDATIGLPGLDLPHRDLIVIPLKGLEPALGHEIDGIIGSSLFDDFIVAIDYEHRTAALSAPGTNLAPAGAVALPVTIDSHGFQYLDATLTLPGAPPVTSKFLIDGGANTCADVYKPFADAHNLPPPDMKLLNEPGTSTGGTTASREGRAVRLSVGPFSVANPVVTFAEDTEGLMAVKDYAGLIGAGFLERFTVVFDNAAKRILLTPNGHYREAAEDDESGLRIRADARDFHRFVVNRIVPGSPAADAGIAAGDVIASIGDRQASELTLTELRHLLSRPRAVYSVGILRGAAHLRLTLKLHPLL